VGARPPIRERRAGGGEDKSPTDAPDFYWTLWMMPRVACTAPL